MDIDGKYRPESGDAVCSDELVRQVLHGVDAKDWDLVKAALHPYLHWSDSAGTLRGRTHVLAHLRMASSPEPPSSYELRDGQIYRWRASPG